MGLALGYWEGQQFQKVAHRLVGSQRERWGLRRRSLLPLRNRSLMVRQVVRMDLAGLVAEPVVGQMRPGVVVELVKMDLGPAGLVVEQLEGLVRFAESLQSVQMHRCRLVEVAVRMG